MNKIIVFIVYKISLIFLSVWMVWVLDKCKGFLCFHSFENDVYDESEKEVMIKDKRFSGKEWWEDRGVYRTEIGHG